MGRFDYTCKKCSNRIDTDILPSDGICPDCRNKPDENEKKYLIDDIIGWELTKIDFNKFEIELTFEKPGWYRKKLKIECGGLDGEIEATFDGLIAIEDGEKYHW